MSSKISGSCLCGAVKYEIENNFEKFYLCHCTQCQKISGSNHVSNLFGKPNSLRWLTGEEKIKRYEYPNRGFTNAFCTDCGSGVPFLNQSGKAVVVRAGTLDGQPQFFSLSKIFHSESPDWNEEAETSKSNENFPITNKE